MARCLKVLALDDEFLALELLGNFVGRVSDLELVGRFESPLAALDFLATESVDLLLLDIEMPQLKGTRLLSVLKNPPVTIFTSAYSDYAVEAFALDAVDYLLKPFSFPRFVQAINKAREQILKEPSLPAREAVISVRAEGKLHRIQIADILFVEGMKEYVRITTPDQRYMAYTRLHQVDALLPANDFVKVHRSFRVGSAHVQTLEGNRLWVGGYEVPVSRDLKKEVVARLFPDDPLG